MITCFIFTILNFYICDSVRNGINVYIVLFIILEALSILQLFIFPGFINALMIIPLTYLNIYICSSLNYGDIILKRPIESDEPYEPRELSNYEIEVLSKRGWSPADDERIKRLGLW